MIKSFIRSLLLILPFLMFSNSIYSTHIVGGDFKITMTNNGATSSSYDIQLTLDSLREVGNLSSASVLYVLKDTLEKRSQETDSYGVLMAMGPGFCNEMVLLQF